MAASTEEKVRENRLRRMAERQGFQLVKSRRRDPLATDYGALWLAAQSDLSRPSAWAGPWFTLDDVEAYLTTPPTERES